MTSGGNGWWSKTDDGHQETRRRLWEQVKKKKVIFCLRPDAFVNMTWKCSHARVVGVFLANQMRWRHASIKKTATCAQRILLSSGRISSLYISLFPFLVHTSFRLPTGNPRKVPQTFPPTVIVCAYRHVITTGTRECCIDYTHTYIHFIHTDLDIC